MTKPFLLLAIFVFASGTAWPGEAYRWTDLDGHIHYGDSIPEQYRNSGRKFAHKDTSIEKTERNSALSSVAPKTIRRPPESATDQVESGAGKDEPATSPQNSKFSSESQCEKAWREYRASLDCFAPYVIVGGGVKTEAFTHCKNLPQPPYCN